MIEIHDKLLMNVVDELHESDILFLQCSTKGFFREKKKIKETSRKGFDTLIFKMILCVHFNFI